MKLKSICTGSYTYKNREGEEQQSHSVYGLDDDGSVWKHIVPTRKWVQLEDIIDKNKN